MKIILAGLLLLSLVACERLSNCPNLKDEAACATDTSCHWNKNENLCKP